MNDFTKEELSLIANGVFYFNFHCKLDKENHNQLNKLHLKIQSMIESYCEHKPEPSPEICCTKCQRTLI